MGAQGTATVDFGAFPGKSDASVVITGQAGIVAGSLVEAWIRPVDTADHLADEHMIETLKVFAHSIVAGTGFTISMFNAGQIAEPVIEDPTPRTIFSVGTAYGVGVPTNLNEGRQVGRVGVRGGKGTLIYGAWSVAWVWN